MTVFEALWERYHHRKKDAAPVRGNAFSALLLILRQNGICIFAEFGCAFFHSQLFV